MYNARRRRRPRNAKRREKDRKRKQERSKEGSPPSPSPTEQPAPAQPDSPFGWFDHSAARWLWIRIPARSSHSPPASSRSPAMSSSSPAACSHSPTASIPRPAAIGSRSPNVRGSRRLAVRGSRSPPPTNSPCPAVSRDNEVSDVETSKDRTSDEERKKSEETLSEEEQKFIQKLCWEIKLSLRNELHFVRSCRICIFNQIPYSKIYQITMSKQIKLHFLTPNSNKFILNIFS